MKVIVHVIDQLGIGGTEILLRNTLIRLREYDHVVVYLNGENNFLPIQGDIPVYCLTHNKKRHFLRSVFRLRKIIKHHRAKIVHSHLLWSTLITRLAKTRKVRTICSLHSVMSEDAFRHSKLVKLIERMTVGRQSAIIGVSSFVMQDYLRQIPFKGVVHLLYNFVPSFFFVNNPRLLNCRDTNHLKCLAVGNLKTVKNYKLILEAFSLLPRDGFELDIAGEGDERELLSKMILQNDLEVKLLGHCDITVDFLKRYDIFIQASSYEGFGIALAEAVAVGLVPVISDIPVHREITGGNAIYFSIQDPMNLASKLSDIWENGVSESTMNACRAYIENIASETTYFNKLRSIYESELNNY